MPRIVILHPGEMGAGVGAELVRAGHDVGWLAAGRSDASRARATDAGMREVTGVEGADVVLSICPPAAALDVARSVAGFRGLFVDANAIGLGTAAEVDALVTGSGAVYIDGGLIGPPPDPGTAVRLALSGPRADEVAGIFAGTGVHARVLAAGPYAASTLKMAYASWTKISQALLVTADEVAGTLGVRDALHDEWADSLPGLSDRLVAAREAAAAKGWRWEGEMREIAATFAAAGAPTGFAEAAAEVFGGHPRR